MKLYAASIYARKDMSESSVIRHMALALVANNAHEARGIALDECETIYPLYLGWTAHSAVVTEVLQSTLDALKHGN